VLAAEPRHANMFRHAQIQLGVTEVATMRERCLDAGFVTVLRIEFDVFDVAVCPALADVQLDGSAAVMVAMQQALDAEVERTRGAAAAKGLRGTGDGLVVAIAIGACGEQPVAARHGVVDVEALRAATVAVECIVGDAQRQHVVGADRIVDAEADAGLVQAGSGGTGIIQRRDHTPRLAAFDGNDQVGLAGVIRRRDVDVDILRRQAFHLLHALLDVAQVEQIAGTHRQCPAPVAGRRVVGHANGMDQAGHERERQYAVGQILPAQAHARGDVAARDDQVARATHDQAEAFVADATASVAIEVALHETEGVAALALQADLPDVDARGFAGQIAMMKIGGRFFAQSRGRGVLARLAVLGLLLGALALLLLIGRDGLVLRHRARRKCRQTRKRKQARRHRVAATGRSISFDAGAFHAAAHAN
jgi:hypothetical protein